MNDLKTTSKLFSVTQPPVNTEIEKLKKYGSRFLFRQTYDSILRTCMGPNFWARPGLNSQIKARPGPGQAKAYDKNLGPAQAQPMGPFQFFTS